MATIRRIVFNRYRPRESIALQTVFFGKYKVRESILNIDMTHYIKNEEYCIKILKIIKYTKKNALT